MVKINFNVKYLMPATEQEGNLAKKLSKSIDKKEINGGIFKAYLDYQGHMRHLIVLKEPYNSALYDLVIKKYEKWKDNFINQQT